MRVDEEGAGGRQYHGCDTLSCLEALAQAKLPLMLMHGLVDSTVEPEAAAAMYEAARGPKGACLIRDADHAMTQRFDAVLAKLREWLPGLLRRQGVLQARPPPISPTLHTLLASRAAASTTAPSSSP